ncbi:WD40 repeat domain-containing protein [Candidatus Babeliales bacterium]|nr:WD40 repeat domain-containing protein [Candidatus Babeliales bacterium]
MKRLLKLLLVLVLCPTLVQATSLDGTSSIVYQDKHYVFRNFNTAKGYVRLNNGFTILAGQSAALDTFVTVSGAIDLRTTGSLDLRGDLFLDAHVTWSSSGKIYGRGNTIHLGGSLSLPTDTVLQFIDDTIIDGDGHTLTLGAHAQLLLASDVSLTLKNMTIKTTRNSSHIPIIRCFDQKGHVTLDNVELALTDDFAFRTGRMFFQNDVVVTGTSCFIYQSWMQSYVMPQSLLTFDPNTTLYYYPSTPDKDLIQLQSKSAGIYLKGSATTLQTTHTGMRLSKGRMWLDNKVTLSTRASTVANGFVQLTTASYGTRVNSVDWSPDGRYLAVGGFGPTNTLEFQIYRFDGSTLTYVTGDNWAGGGTEVYSVRWHPNGRFIVAGGDATNDLRVYSFDGTSLTTITVTDVTTAGAVGRAVWSPSGQYILCATFSDSPDDKVRIYRFNGVALSTVTTISPAGANSTFVLGPAWHPSEKYFAFRLLFPGSLSSPRYLYSFDGATATLVDTFSVGNSSPGLVSSWEFSPDGRYMVEAIGRATGFSRSFIFGFSETGFSPTAAIALINYSSVDNVISEARWNPDGQYIVAVGGSPDNGNELQLYNFDQSTISEVASYNYGTSINGVAWSVDSKYVAIGGNGPAGGHDEIEVWTVSYRFDTSTQALTNGLTLGKSASGASFDLDTYVLSGATVNLAGQLMYDSTS